MFVSTPKAIFLPFLFFSSLLHALIFSQCYCCFHLHRFHPAKKHMNINQKGHIKFVFHHFVHVMCTNIKGDTQENCNLCFIWFVHHRQKGNVSRCKVKLVRPDDCFTAIITANVTQCSFLATKGLETPRRTLTSPHFCETKRNHFRTFHTTYEIKNWIWLESSLKSFRSEEVKL